MGSRSNFVRKTLQETKLEAIDSRTLREICGLRLQQHQVLMAQGTRVGILIAWAPTKFTLMQYEIRRFSLSILLKNNVDGTQFWFLRIYGPINPAREKHVS